MEHGLITSVNYKQGAVLCNVQAIRVSTEYRDVPVMKPFSGTIQMPKLGQKVLMETLDDGTRFIIGYLAREEDRPSEMDQGEMTIQVGPSTKISLTKDDDTWDVDLSASGTISVDADGDVKIDGIDFDQHVHDHEESVINDTDDGSGTKSTTTKQTSPPK